MLKYCTALLLLANASFAVVVESFDRTDSGIAETPALKASIVEAPPESGGTKTLSLEWTTEHKAWAECVYTKPVPLAGFAADQPSALRMNVQIPPSPSIVSFSVRLLDKENEVFQWSAKLSPSQGGSWQQITIPIDPEKHNGHWGGRPNGKVDFPVRLLGYAFIFANTKVPEGRILIGDIHSVSLPRIELETNQFPGIVLPGNSGTCQLAITNPDTQPVTATFKGKITDYSGTSSEVSATAPIPADGKATMQIPVIDSAPGIRWIEGVMKFGTTEISYKNAFLIADPIKRISGPEDFLFGICSHTERHPADIQEKEMQAAAAAGATVMRISPAWVSIEPKPGQWRWDLQDHLVELAARYGIETQPILGYGPSHAVSEELRTQQQEAYKKRERDPWKITLFGPPREEAWRTYVSEMAKRYRGKIRFYEIWNEPDLSFWRGTTDEYIAILRTAHEEIRRADPQAKVMTGGFATVLPHSGRARNPDLQERVLSEANNAFDIHAFHQHGPFSEFYEAAEGELKRIRSRMSSPKPIYFNETAISSMFGGEKFQARTLVKKMAYVMASGAIGYTWYDLRDDGTSATDPEHNYGLVKQDFTPKASFAAYLELVRQLQGMRPLGRLDLGVNYFAYGFGSSRGRVLVLWNEGEQTATLPMLLRSGGSPVKTVDIMGRSRELQQFNNIVMTSLTGEPVYLNFAPGEGLPEFVGPFVQLNTPNDAFVGQPVELAAVINNPLPRDLTVKLNWSQTGGKNSAQQLVIPANGNVRVPIESGKPSPQSPHHSINLQYAAEGLPWTGNMRRVIPVIRLIDSVAADNRQPDWIIDQKQDIVSFTGADPSLAALHWRGSQDLSAQVWLWRQGDSLFVRADVRDDIHVQKEKAENMWKADSVQFAFAKSDSTDYWEFGVAQHQDGQILRAMWKMPAGAVDTNPFFTADCSAISGGKRYDIRIPLDKLNMDEASLAKGLRFNLIVNDSDSNVRKQLVRIAPGIGEQKNPKLFTRIQFATQQTR